MGDAAGIQNASFGECKGDSPTEMCIYWKRRCPLTVVRRSELRSLDEKVLRRLAQVISTGVLDLFLVRKKNKDGREGEKRFLSSV